MLAIPTDMDRWHPNDVADWSAGLDDDPTVTDAEYAQARRAVSVALLGDELADTIHGPATP